MADVSTTASWFPVVTLVAGYVLKVFSDLLQNKWSSKKDREARDAARLEKRYERRSAFQRETLLNLQEAIQKLGRATSQANYHDEMAFREKSQWRKNLLPDDVNSAYLEAQTQTGMLSARVRDEQVRELVKQFKADSVAVIRSRDREEASQQLMKMMKTDDPLQSRIGELIRQIDDDKDT